MSRKSACNCDAWSCTCNGKWRATSGRFCHVHGTPHPSGFWRLWQQLLRVTQ
jgi:hypothetical protein